MPAQPLTSIPAPSGRIDGSGSSPMATRTAAAGSSRVAPVGAHDVRPPAPVSPVGRSTSHADRDDGAVTPDDLGRGHAVRERDALPLCGLDLLVLRRHVLAAAPVDDGDRGCAAALRRASRVHRGAAAADDDHVARQVRVLAEVDLLEEPGRRDDAPQLVAGNAQAATLGCARWRGRSP